MRYAVSSIMFSSRFVDYRVFYRRPYSEVLFASKGAAEQVHALLNVGESETICL
jgi:hypothetical protein